MAGAMKARDLRLHADAMRVAINETVRLVRTSAGRCCCCGAATGVHAQACAVWPIIAARAAYAADADPDLFNETQP
jgi:hypothetical protein